MTPLPDDLRDWASGVLGTAVDGATFRGQDHAVSAVWELSLEDGSRAFLKQASQRRKFIAERAAYRDWASRLPATPRLLAEDEARAILLLEALPGAVADELDLPLPVQVELHRRAGEWLRGLHILPVEDEDPLPLGRAYRQRCAAWFERAAGLVDAADLAWARDAARALDGLDDVVRVPCHRDYSPRNWLVQMDGHRLASFAVIDFEHARPDWWLGDLDRLAGDHWQRHPELAAAFYEGYGRRPDGTEVEIHRAFAAFTAVSTVVWSVEHGDAAFEAHGRRRLERLRAMPDGGGVHGSG